MLAHGEALEAARKGLALWRATSAYDRAKLLRKAADLVRERAEAIARIMTQEQGKVLGEARIEVLVTADIIEWFAEEGRRAYGRIIPGRVKGTRQLVVTEGALTGTRITLGSQPVLIGRADDSTLVLTDDYASTRHARLSPRGSEWYVEDLGSTNGTYLDRAKVTTAVRVPMGTPVRIGKTVIELRP